MVISARSPLFMSAFCFCSMRGEGGVQRSWPEGTLQCCLAALLSGRQQRRERRRRERRRWERRRRQLLRQGQAPASGGCSRCGSGGSLRLTQHRQLHASQHAGALANLASRGGSSRRRIGGSHAHCLRRACLVRYCLFSRSSCLCRFSPLHPTPQDPQKSPPSKTHLEGCRAAGSACSRERGGQHLPRLVPQAVVQEDLLPRRSAGIRERSVGAQRQQQWQRSRGAARSRLLLAPGCGPWRRR